MLRRRDMLALAPALWLLACNRKGATEGRKALGIAYALGGKGDKSYNDALARALPALSRHFEITEYSPLTPDEYGPALTNVAAGPAELILCVGFIYDTYVDAIAGRYRQKRFCVFDGAPKAANAVGVQFRVDEATALAGVVAADRSKTKILGFVGGSDIPPITPFVEGFEIGAKRLHPETKVLRSYIGSGAEAFTNPARGRDHALRLIRAGADVLFHAAGTSGDGAISAAKAEGRLAVGVDIDQTAQAPGTVITNVLKRLDVAAVNLADRFRRGEGLPPGVLKLGLKEGAVGITDPAVDLSPEAQALITRLTQEFGGGGG